MNNIRKYRRTLPMNKSTQHIIQNFTGLNEYIVEQSREISHQDVKYFLQ